MKWLIFSQQWSDSAVFPVTILLDHPVQKIFILLSSFSLPLRSPNCCAIGIIRLPGYMKRNCILPQTSISVWETDFCGGGTHTFVLQPPTFAARFDAA